MSLRLFSSDALDFTGLGKGFLKDARSDEVHEIMNGMFELTFQYPMTGRLYDGLYDEAVVMAKPNDIAPAQPFRIYRRSNTINGWVTVYARHLYYDLRRYVCEPFSTGASVSWTEAAPLIQRHIFPECPFAFVSDYGADAPRWDLKEPMAVWDMLTPGKGFLKEDDRIELEPDGLTVGLMKRRGADRGVSIRYGRNLRNITADTEGEGWVNGVYPYLYDEEKNLVQLPERYLTDKLLPGSRARIKPLLVEVMFSDAYTIETWGSLEAYLRFRGEAEAGNLSMDSVARQTVDIDFVQLSKTQEYEKSPLPDSIAMGDTVHLEYPGMGVEVSGRVSEIRYQPSTGLYKKIVLGDPKRNVLRTLAGR